MKKILFVCLGNICRSPLAQGIFEDKIAKMNLQDYYFADSAGVSAWHEGELPHSGSIKVAKENSVSIEKQRSRPVTSSDGREFDYLIAMDANNYHALLHEFGVSKEKVFLMRQFETEKFEAKAGDVPDPWGHGPEAFRDVFAILDRSTEGLIRFLQKSTK
ncbi:MAG: low molecular weight phosphotyrosine protein phosphatase [Leptospiraceae bacterium]|nr:low molecular weight phosphotyrosine protein phosphatase [Leptospiraceae bacterium]